MKVTVIYGCTNYINYNALSLSEIIYNTFSELDVTLEKFDLSTFEIPFLNSPSPNINVTSIMNSIASSDGVLLICTTHMLMPSAIMKNFIDYFSLPIYENSLRDKNCFLLTISDKVGEKNSLNYLSDIVQHLGGFDSISFGINHSVATSITTTSSNKLLLEKYIEDFYRYLRQNRSFFTNTTAQHSMSNVITNTSNTPNNLNSDRSIPTANRNIPTANRNIPTANKNIPTANKNIPTANKNIPTANKNIPKANKNIPKANKNIPKAGENISTRFIKNPYVDNDTLIKKTIPKPKPQPQPPQQQQQRDFDNNNVYNNNYLETDSDKAFLDNILSDEPPNNIDNNLNTEYSDSLNNFLTGHPSVINEPLVPMSPDEVIPRATTINQKIQSLAHHLKPTVANGITTNFQLNVFGDENFDCYLNIDNNYCTYFNGVSNNSGVTISGNSTVWERILKGTLSTQRAFMTGQVKVTGNFTLLSKFDQLFKFNF